MRESTAAAELCDQLGEHVIVVIPMGNGPRLLLLCFLRRHDATAQSLAGDAPQAGTSGQDPPLC